jgi:hypothetical protein
MALVVNNHQRDVAAHREQLLPEVGLHDETHPYATLLGFNTFLMSAKITKRGGKKER